MTVRKTTDVERITVIEDRPAVILRRVVGIGGTPVTAASLASITRTVTDLDTGVITNTATLAKADVIFDTLQTVEDDPRWAAADDDLGYNFADVPPGTCWPTGDHTYLVEYVFTGTDGHTLSVIVRVWAQPLAGS
jgi:hypothetical protein